MRNDNETLVDNIIKRFLELLSLLLVLNVGTMILAYFKITSLDEPKLILSNLVLLITSVINFFIVTVYKLLTKPIKIEVELVNAATKEEKTIIYHNHESRDDAKTLVLKIKIIGTFSYWSYFALKHFGSKALCIAVYHDEDKPYLVCQPCANVDSVQCENSGLLFNISDIIKSKLKYSVPREREFRFIVNENRDIPLQSNEKIPMKPILLIAGKEPNLFNKLFISFFYNSKSKYHEINFVR